MKALLIKNTTQQSMLASRYDVEQDDRAEVFPLDHWVVVDTFGDDHNYEVLTQIKFAETYELNGVILKNGFLEIRRL